jgi:anti-sigma B factor antagonist
MAPQEVQLRIERVPAHDSGTSVFRLSGALDLTTVDQLRATVGPVCADGGEVVLDLSALSFCDSTGVGAFVWLHRQATAAGGRLLLAAPRRYVRDVLRISGVDRAIPVRGRGALNGGRPPQGSSGPV